MNNKLNTIARILKLLFLFLPLFSVVFMVANVLLSKEVLAACTCDSSSGSSQSYCNAVCGGCPCTYTESGKWEELDYSMCERYSCSSSCSWSRHICWGSYADNCQGRCGGGCFVEGTEVATKELKNGETEKLKNIESLEPGDIVSSFNPETGEISESKVAEVHKLTREGYYELETESGKKVKVTAEHPFLAIKSEENLISKLKNALSNTLTFRLITGLQAKLIEVLD